jgi:hypothetical protein
VSSSDPDAADEYDIHGNRLDVRGPTEVRDALKVRLGSFVGGDGPPALDVRFLEGLRLERPAGKSRPVYDTPHGSVDYYPANDELWAELAGVQMHCEPTRGRALFAAGTFRGELLYLATHPLMTICLMELFKRRARYPLHAGALADQAGRGVLLAGPSGAGKSTLTIALVRAGLGFLSDDIVFLEQQPDAVDVLAFPDALGVTEGTRRMFPELSAPDGQSVTGFPKRLRRVEDVWDVAMPDRCRAELLLFPEIVPGASGLVPLPPGDALLRLTPDVLLTQRAASQEHLRAVGALLEQVSCYRILSGPQLDATARVVRDLLRRRRQNDCD